MIAYPTKKKRGETPLYLSLLKEKRSEKLRKMQNFMKKEK